MSSKLGILIGVSLGLGALFGLWLFLEPNEVASRSQGMAHSLAVTDPGKPAQRPSSTPGHPVPQATVPDVPVLDASKLPTAVPEILASIDDAAVSYDAKELPRIQPYLLHPEPEVRKAALDGMLTLGDAAASPMLRSAAQLATSPEEAVAMKQAADYLELPSGSILNAKIDKSLMRKKAKP